MGQTSRRLWKLGKHYLEERERHKAAEEADQRTARPSVSPSAVTFSTPSTLSPVSPLETLLVRFLRTHDHTVTPDQLAKLAHCSPAIAEAFLDDYVLADKADVRRDASGALRYTFPIQAPPVPPSTPPKTEPTIEYDEPLFEDVHDEPPVDDPVYLHCLLTGKERVAYPEERERQAALHILLYKLGYPKSGLRIEYPIRMGRSKKSADIVGFWPHSEPVQENIQFLIEVKAPTISAHEAERGRDQLKSYVAAAMNCRFAAFIWKRWYNFDVITRHDGRRGLMQRKDFPIHQDGFI